MDGTEIRLRAGDHVVHFYDAEDELQSIVGGYLARAVLEGDAVIVIATREHWEAFRAAMVTAGIDVGAAQAGDQLIVLDAARTMGQFMAGDSPDVGAFEAVVGDAVRRAGGAGRKVSAYGEMVALLWQAGNVLGALELELLWNGLGARLPFSLFCTYPTESLAAHGGTEATADVCHLHSAVVGRTVV